MPEPKEPVAPLLFTGKFSKPRPYPTPEADSRPLTPVQMVAEASAAVKAHISRQPHVQRVFSFMPTLMTRVSPFHFRNKNTTKDWPLVRLDSGDHSGWGKMRVVGELLVIFDETVLFCLLALMRRSRSEAFETTEADICRLAKVTGSRANCNATWHSLQRLAGTRIDLALLSGRGKRKKTVRQMTGSILTYCDRNVDTGAVRIAVNPYFLQMYGDSFVTNIDLSFRQGLKTDVAKALYRYLQGQVRTQLSLPVLQLARAVNLDMDAGEASATEKVASGLKELQARGYLIGHGIDTAGAVAITKAPGVAIDQGQASLG
ncbi:MAG: hypothetical protein ABIL58_10830 [Pseudomonadota bacterium]